MKKILLITLLCAFLVPAFSQITTLSDAELGFAVDAAVPMSGLKATQKTGVGGSIKFAYTIYNSTVAPSFQAGFLSFSGKPLPDSQTLFLKDTYKPLLFIPVKFGLRYTFSHGIYVEPQAGASIILAENDMGEANNSTGFTYAFNVGFQTLPGIDISARYESVNFSNGAVSMVGIRIGYHFTFRRQEIY